MNQTDVTIVILNYKSRGLVKQVLKNIFSRGPINYHVIVVDNNSQDGCMRMIEEDFPAVETIASPRNVGFAAGNNLALKKVESPFVLIMNPDVAVMPEGIEKMHTFMKEHPEVGICGPKLINPDGSVQYSCYRFPGFLTPLYRRTILGKLPWGKKELGRYLMKDFNHMDVRPVPWLLGGCLMVRVSALKKVGLLDERFFLYLEDADWCRRFWEGGYTVYYYPPVEMIHYHQRLSAEHSGIKSFFKAETRHHIVSWLKYELKYFAKKEPRIH